ncbi:MAG: Maf family protein [Gammaproteobacteria bacterium]
MTILILASSSPYRRELLERLGIDFEVVSPAVDESLRAEETPAAATLRLARAKAQAVAARRPEALILASDQLASLDGEALGKPHDAETARRWLAQMSGRTVTYHTAVALLAPGESEAATHLDQSHAVLRRFDAGEIARYLEQTQPLDCAGALRLEGLGAALCERIETADPTALIGLPLIATARLLRDQGYTLP